MHAEPTTFGAKFALWALQADRDRRRLQSARDGIAVGKLSGAVGTFSNIDPAVEASVCAALGLTPVPATQVIARDRHAEYFYACAAIGSTIELMCTEIRHLARSELGEAEEPFGAGQKGSSAMPHKRNPILSERLCGLARLQRGYLGAGLEDVALWHERDISHSSVERVALPDASLLACYMLRKATGLAAGLVVHPERALQNLTEGTLGLVFSQSVLLALVSGGLTRDEAYRIVQRDARLAWEERRPLRAVLEADGEVTLDDAQLDAAFDLTRTLRHVDRFADAGLAPCLMSVDLPRIHSGKVRELYDAGDGRLVMVASDRVERVRRDHGGAHHRQRAGVDGHDELLVRRDGRHRPRVADHRRPGGHGRRAGRRRLAGRLGRPGRPGAAGRDAPPRVHRARLPRRRRPTRSTPGGHRARHAHAGRPAAGQPAGGAHLHPLHQGDRGPRPQHRLRRRRRPGGRGRGAAAKHISLALYRRAAARCAEAGFVLADTKFESGYVDGELCLCDEVCTPDSSRLWPADQVVPGQTPPAFDKQPLRDWLAAQPWDRTPPPPPLPDEVTAAMSARYVAAYERVTGRSLGDWYGAEA